MTTTPEPYAQYVAYINMVEDVMAHIRRQDDNALIRKGQIAFNALIVMHTDLAEEVRGTEFDPFYFDESDKQLTDFYIWLFKRLTEQSSTQVVPTQAN